MAHTMADYECMVTTFAHHCGCIMTDPAPTRFKCGIGYTTADNEERVLLAEIKIVRSTMSTEGTNPDVWDQVQVNGKHCGNRCGGREEFAKIMAPMLAEAARTIEKVEAT